MTEVMICALRQSIVIAEYGIFGCWLVKWEVTVLTGLYALLVSYIIRISLQR